MRRAAGAETRLQLMVIVALLCAGPAMAGDERALHAIVAGGNAFDLTTTMALRNRSTVFEGNPFMRHATGAGQRISDRR